MNKLDAERRAAVVAALVEGNSIRATVRMTGVAKNTIVKLLVELGTACASYMDKALVNLPCHRIQCDEIWAFAYAKKKNVTPEIAERQIAGDVWTWIAMDADTKVGLLVLVGRRDLGCATEFVHYLAGRLANCVQFTTDGYKIYLDAVYGAFGDNIDYGCS